ncbi:PAS domain-containing protein [Candidatus Omnitrophota bacterium]
MNDRKKTKAQLIAELEKLRNLEKAPKFKKASSPDDADILLNNIQAAVIIHDAHAKIISCNVAAEKMLGVTRAQMLGTETVNPAWKFIDENGNCVPEEKYPVNQVLANKQPVTDIAYSIHKENNTIQWLYVSANPLFDADGEISRVVVTFMDISYRKIIEESLRKSEHQLRMLTDTVPGYIAYVGIDDLCYIYVNQWFETAFGLNREEIIGQHIKDIIGQENYQTALEHIEKVKLGKQVSYDTVFNLKQGKRWIKVDYVPDFDKQGNVVGIVVLSIDITDRKKAEEALRKEKDFSQNTINSSFDMIVTVNRERRIVEFNAAGKIQRAHPKQDAAAPHEPEYAIPGGELRAPLR